MCFSKVEIESPKLKFLQISVSKRLLVVIFQPLTNFAGRKLEVEGLFPFSRE